LQFGAAEVDLAAVGGRIGKYPGAVDDEAAVLLAGCGRAGGALEDAGYGS